MNVERTGQLIIYIHDHVNKKEARYSISFKLPSYSKDFLYIKFVTYVTVKSCYHLFYELCNMHYKFNVILFNKYRLN